jgi:hypothetical protein
MDITINELKTMKVKQLRRLIRESVMEVLNEETYAGKEAVKDLKSDPSFGSLAPDAKQNAEKELQKGGSVTLEGEIDEMARIAKGFRLTDPNLNTATYTKSISGTPLSAILDYFRENPGADVKSIQTQFNFVRPQIANGLVKGLLDAGILTKLTAGGEVVPTAAPGEEQPETIDGPESFLIGGGDPLAGMFDGEPNDDGSEDFNDEIEPTLGDLEPDEELPSTPSTDKEKAADFTIDDANSRLIQSIINNYTTLKSRIKGGGEMGGIAGSDMMTAIRSSKAAAELKFPQKMQQLIDKIKEQEPAVQKAIMDSLIIKFASVKLPSLAKAIAKELNVDAKIPTLKTPIEEPEEEIEDTLDEAFDAEYTKRKLQFYAGIIK